MKGSKMELLMICPERASSTKPTTDASEVFLTIWTMKPTVGGVASRTACGSTTLNMRCVRLSARHSAASHCARGTAWMAPRQISPR